MDVINVWDVCEYKPPPSEKGLPVNLDEHLMGGNI